MKTLSALFLIFLTAGTISGQINSGAALITGSVSYSMTTIDSDLSPGEITESNLDLQLGIGYFMGENFVLGLNAGYEMGETTSFISVTPEPEPIEQSAKTSIVKVGPFARYYLMIGEKAGFFGQADIGFGFGKREIEGSPGVDISRIEAALRPGIALFLSDQWAIEGKFGYLGYMKEKEEYNTPDQSTETITSNFQVSFNFTTLSFGLAFYPGRNNE